MISSCTEFWKIRRISDGKFLDITTNAGDFPPFTDSGDRRFRKFDYAVQMCNWLAGKPSNFAFSHGPIHINDICQTEIVKYRESLEELGVFDPVIPTVITADML